MRANIARHEHATCLAPGLFISLKNAGPKPLKSDLPRPRPALNVKYQFNDTTIEFTGAAQLGVDDLRVLQGLVSLAGKDGGELGLSPKTEDGKALRANLKITNEASAIMVKCSYKTLFTEIGMSGGGAQIKSLVACLKRLFGVTIIVTEGKKWHGFHLLSIAKGNASSLLVALNPAIAMAITGGQFVKIDMNEVRSLKSDPARLLHQRICSFIDPGKANNIALGTLSGYVWGVGATNDINANLAQYRRKIILRALTELKLLGWHIVEVKAGMFRVQRP